MSNDDDMPIPPWRLPADPHEKVEKCPIPPWRYHPPPLDRPRASKPAAKQGNTMSKKKQKFAIQKRQLICPDCHQPTRRTESRLVKVSKGYTVHGVTSYHFGHLCKACAERRKASTHLAHSHQQIDQAQAAGR